MMTLSFTLNRQIIIRTDGNKLVAGSQNYVRAKFTDICGDWTRPITAIFSGYTQLLDDSGECIIPWEAVQSAGSLTVSAFCGSLHTANSVSIPILPTGYTQGQTPQPPTPDVYAQLTEIAQNAIDVAQSVRDEADAGDFDGPPGPQGEPGADGVQINDGAVTTTDAWSSQRIVDTLCPAFKETGDIVTCNPVTGYPLSVSVQNSPESAQITRCGINLMPYSKPRNADQTVNGIRYQWGEDGRITVAGTASERSDSVVMNFDSLYLPPGTYRMITPSSKGVRPQFVVKKAETGNNFWYGAEKIEIESGDIPQYFYIATEDGASVDTTAYAFLSYGAEELKESEFEPYNGNTYAIGNTIPALAGINTIYSDSGSVTVAGRSDPVAIINSLQSRLAALESAQTNL